LSFAVWRHPALCNAYSAMNPQQARIVVRRTFLQVIDVPVRSRALTDTLLGCGSPTDALLGYGLRHGKEQVPEDLSDGTTLIPNTSVAPSDVCESDASEKLRWADVSPTCRRTTWCVTEHHHDDRTTLMFRNLPNAMSVDAFIVLLNAQGFAHGYDFAYMPVDFRTSTTLGYSFVNFVSSAWAQRAQRHFDNFSAWSLAGCTEPCVVIWSDKEQGVQANVERYRNSPVMHASVPDEYKPRLFVYGHRVDFPAPTLHLKAPKHRKSRR